jgi:hypothetical protein
MQDAGFDVSFRDCTAKGGTGGHPSPASVKIFSSLAFEEFDVKICGILLR